jgi:hypothetical protein
VPDSFDAAEIRALYLAQLGRPIREAEFKARDFSVEILKWAPSRATGDAFLYLTLGASRIALGGPAGHRLDYFLGLDQEHDDIARVLADIAGEPVRNGVLVDAGQTVTFPSPLWKGSAFRTLLVFQSGLPVVPDAPLSDGTHFTMRGLAPLHKSELEAKKRIGYEKLWAQFATMNVPLGDPNRPAAKLRVS